MKQLIIATTIVLMLGTASFSQESEETGGDVPIEAMETASGEGPLDPMTGFSLWIDQLRTGINFIGNALVFIAVISVAQLGILIAILVIIVTRKRETS